MHPANNGGITAVSCHLHLNLLMHLAEKILLMQPLTFGGITSAYIFGQDAEQSGITSAADHTAGHILQRHPVLASRGKPRHADADVF